MTKLPLVFSYNYSKFPFVNFLTPPVSTSNETSGGIKSQRILEF
jgi:hypothetical protein